MLNYFGSVVPYLLTGFAVYLAFRAAVWCLYRKGEMQVPVWHEVGFLLLAVYLLVLFSASVTPTLDFSIKPSIEWGDLVPVKGMIGLTKESGILSVLGMVLRFVPLGFLFPLLFRRFQNFFRVLALGGVLSLFVEVFQLFLSPKTRTDDVILSLLGIFLGYFLFGILVYFLPEFERLATVRRSRRRRVPFVVKKELEICILLMLLTVVGRGAMLTMQEAHRQKAGDAFQVTRKEVIRKAVQEAEDKLLAEAEAKKLKVAEAMPELSLEAQSACLFSVDDDLILYEKNAEAQVVPASTTKLLTALTVLKYCEPEETLTAGEEISLISQGASTASLKPGIKGSVKTFLGAMLLPSGNDAAYTLANYAGHKILGDDAASTADAIEKFVEAMNGMGAELGLENSCFLNPDGDHAEGQYTTVHDMVRIARACLENELIAELSAKASFRALFDNKDVTYKNSNLLLQKDSEYYYEGSIGLKTGSFNDTKNLIGALEVDGRRYVTAVMQDSEEGRWKDTCTLFDLASGKDGE